MTKKVILSIILMISIFFSGCIGGEDDNGDTVVELVYMAGCGTMPSALANDQIDAYIAWQPLVSVAEVGEIGKIVAYSQEMPPEGQWSNHPCCCLVATDAFLEQDHDVSKYLTMLMIYADIYVESHEGNTVDYCADWLFGGGDLTFGDITVNSRDVEASSIETIRFVTEPSQDWLDGIEIFIESLTEIEMIGNELLGTSSDALLEKVLSMDVFYEAMAEIESGAYRTREVAVDDVQTVNFGYLPSDHDAALFVAAYDWEYFKDTYGIYLYSEDPDNGTSYQLMINDTLVANVNVIQFAGGSAAMTSASQGNVDYAIVGAPPVIQFIDQGAPVKIISPVQTEGSGVVVSNDVAAENWDDFVQWIKDSYQDGKVIKIGVPMLGSIQDVMIKYSLQESGITIQT